MPNVTVYGRKFALILLLYGCKPGPTQTAPTEDETTAPGTCVTDTSKETATAIPWTAPVQGQVCPRADVDFYSFTVPAGQDLVDVSAGFGSVPTRVDLSVQLYGGDGSLIPAVISDTTTEDTNSNIKATFHLGPANYFAAVRDVSDDERDDQNQYTLGFVFAKDPDAHEPNDTIATAKTVDGQAAYFAYSGDIDTYKVTIDASTPILVISINNASGSLALVHYSVQDASGKELASGDAIPGMPLTEQRVVPGGGDFFLLLTQEKGRLPDRRPEASYTLTVTQKAEPDANETPTRNDTAATPTCFLGTAPNCDTAFNGSTDLGPFNKTGRISTNADQDYYAVTIPTGTPAVLEIKMNWPASVTQPQFDLLFEDPSTTCSDNGQCEALAGECDNDDDCEMTSHLCLPGSNYSHCPTAAACKLCIGSNICLPPKVIGASGHCAVAQFSKNARMSGATGLVTAQPLFRPGTYYINVHDYQDDNFDDQTSYDLTVRVLAEPDVNDQGQSPAARNNFYDPVPIEAPGRSMSRAIDVTDSIRAPTGVQGYISYSSDEDWYKFKYPCPGAVTGGTGPVTCHAKFEWDQPAAGRMRLLMYIRSDDGNVVESFFTKLNPNVAHTEAFGGDNLAFNQCDECSFFDASYAGGDLNTYMYVSIRDVGADDYDTAGGPYHFRLQVTNNGCPEACKYYMPDVCTCYCNPGGCPAQDPPP